MLGTKFNFLILNSKTMKPRSIKPLNLDELEKLTTERLLAYLRKLQQCEDSLECSDWSEDELVKTSGIVLKNSEQWRQQHELIKTVLSDRSNID